jgi:phage FluMu gp28-like protein
MTVSDPIDAAIDKALPPVFLLYQQELWQTIERFNLVVVEKSRRTGYSWALAAISEDYAARSRSARGQDVLYMGYDKEMAREFIDYVAEWAKSLAIATSAVEEFIFNDPDHPEKDINAFRIKFASGYEVIALPSVARALRGKQGLVILDEAAFMDDLEEVLKAAMALLMWGGRVVVVSTHNGETNAFNTLINDIRGGRRSGKVLRLTFKEAVAQGLYNRVCLRMGIDWTQEGEDAWVADIYSKYGDSAAEELDCIANPSTGAYLPGALIEARSDKDVPVLRYTGPDGIGTWPEHVRRAVVQDWINENVKPVVDAFSPRDLFAVGEDFARIRDLTVLWFLAITGNLRRETRLVVELRNVPFEQQKQILHWILDRIRFRAAKLDAGGNGAYLAEVTMQRYGARVEEVKFTEDWYRQNWPPAKAALEDDIATLPMDRDIHTDLRSVKLIRGVARIADRTRVDEKASRHGDAAIAFVLAYAASCADPEEYAYEPAAAPPPQGARRWRDRAEDFDEDDERMPGMGILPALRGTAAWPRP